MEVPFYLTPKSGLLPGEIRPITRRNLTDKIQAIIAILSWVIFGPEMVHEFKGRFPRVIFF